MGQIGDQRPENNNDVGDSGERKGGDQSTIQALRAMGNNDKDGEVSIDWGNAWLHAYTPCKQSSRIKWASLKPSSGRVRK